MTRKCSVRSGFVALMAAVCAIADAAEIYKYKAPDGSIVFTDTKPAVPAEKMTVEPARTPTTSERSDAARRQQALEGVARARLQQQAEESAAAREAETRRQRAEAERCRKAREESVLFQSDGVYVTVDADGKRVFFSNEEINRRRAAAKRDVAQYCG